MADHDREMLELAALAMGLDIQEDFYSNLLWVREKPGDLSGPVWNPLEDDGDALRLATACGICIEPYPLYSMPKHSVITKQRRRSDQLRESNPTECIELYGSDKDAATRRAIVRAAAEIGRRMKEAGNG